VESEMHAYKSFALRIFGSLVQCFHNELVTLEDYKPKACRV
jgi:hypothetical protein